MLVDQVAHALALSVRVVPQSAADVRAEQPLEVHAPLVVGHGNARGGAGCGRGLVTTGARPRMWHALRGTDAAHHWRRRDNCDQMPPTATFRARPTSTRDAPAGSNVGARSDRGRRRATASRHSALDVERRRQHPRRSGCAADHGAARGLKLPEGFARPGLQWRHHCGLHGQAPTWRRGCAGWRGGGHALRRAHCAAHETEANACRPRLRARVRKGPIHSDCPARLHDAQLGHALPHGRRGTTISGPLGFAGRLQDAVSGASGDFLDNGTDGGQQLPQQGVAKRVDVKCRGIRGNVLVCRCWRRERTKVRGVGRREHTVNRCTP
mmetsp:Transcript_18651/g.51153  ORF Transcript_18651/g.51153 Transcript_18651/m.51153 type:complete len:324 (+) Transcript_18651:360-1331(+)